MPDYVRCYTGPQDVLMESGKGHLAGLIASTTEAVSGACSFYDYSGAAPVNGPKFFDIVFNANTPVISYFNDRFAPRFVDGIWLHLSDHCYLTVWFHIPPTV